MFRSPRSRCWSGRRLGEERSRDGQYTKKKNCFHCAQENIRHVPNMKQLSRSLLILSLSLVVALPAIAQERKRVSPHETITADIDGATVTIVYGRPYSKDPKSGAARKIWGELVPFG